VHVGALLYFGYLLLRDAEAAGHPGLCQLAGAAQLLQRHLFLDQLRGTLLELAAAGSGQLSDQLIYIAGHGVTSPVF
jgi:hypothetical protein